MLPCSQSIFRALLSPIASWCLDTFGEDAPMLVGVQLGPESVHFCPIQLTESDPLADLATLRAPDEWDVAVLVAPTEPLNDGRFSGVLTHAVDREGRAATYLDEHCGRRRPLRAATGPVHTLCCALFLPR